MKTRMEAESNMKVLNVLKTLNLIHGDIDVSDFRKSLRNVFNDNEGDMQYYGEYRMNSACACSATWLDVDRYIDLVIEPKDIRIDKDGSTCTSKYTGLIISTEDDEPLHDGHLQLPILSNVDVHDNNMSSEDASNTVMDMISIMLIDVVGHNLRVGDTIKPSVDNGIIDVARSDSYIIEEIYLGERAHASKIKLIK